LCAEDSNQLSTQGGPTLDWVIAEESGADTPISTLNTGLWGGDNAVERGRIVHSWRGVDQPNEPISDTLQLFDYVFGGLSETPGTDSAREQRYRTSVLDAVLEDFNRVTSEASGYSSSVRRVVDNHAQTVRDLERQVLALAEGAGACMLPSAPESVGGNGVQPSDFNRWDENWRIMTDLFVLALRCDLVRTGTLMVGSGGDSFSYSGPGGFINDVHQDFDHQWRDLNSDQTALWLESRSWQYQKVAALLEKLDDQAYLDLDGATLLDNTTVLIGSELGDPLHDLEGLVYFLAGGRGRFQRGMHQLSGHTDVDLYTTVLQGLGFARTLGNQTRFEGLLPILA
jgi:hypothetical protein